MSLASKTNSASSPDSVLLPLFGAVLSFFVVGLQFAEPLGSDEVWTLAAVQHNFAEILAILRADVHPPLYFLLLKLWSGVFGPSDLALQSLSALLFLLSQLALYRFFARRALPVAGVFAALFLLNPLGLLVSHFGRMYALLLLLQLLSLLSWWRLTEEQEPERRHWLAFLSLQVLGSFTHIWFFFHIAALFLVTLFYPAHPRRRAALVCQPLALLPYAILWAPTLWRQLRLSTEAGAWLAVPGGKDLLDTLLLHLVLAAPVLLALGIYWLFRRTPPPWPRQAFALAAWLLLFLGIPFALSFYKPIYYQRFTIGALPVFALLSAFSLPQVPHSLAKAAIFCLALCVSLFALFQYRNPPPCNSRWTARYLEERLRPGDQVIFTSLSRAPIQHYAPVLASRSQTFPAEIDRHSGYEPDYKRLAASYLLLEEAERLGGTLQLQQVKRVWLVHGFRPLVSDAITTVLGKKYRRRETHSYLCASTPCYHNRIDLYVSQP